jgi:hypothetical protein
MLIEGQTVEGERSSNPESRARLQTQLYLRQAYALAGVHDASGCTTAISKARNQVEHLADDKDHPWLYWIMPAWIMVEAGDSLLLLGHADRAVAMLDEGIALFDESFARDRQIYLTHLADALARPGMQRDLDAAADRCPQWAIFLSGRGLLLSVNLLVNELPVSQPLLDEWNLGDIFLIQFDGIVDW